MNMIKFLYYRPKGQIYFDSRDNLVEFEKVKLALEKLGWKVEIEETDLGKQIERIKK